MQTSSLSPPAIARLRQGRRGLVAFAAVGILALAVSFGAHLWLEYESQVASAERSVQKLSRSLEEHTATVFETVDALLRLSADRLNNAWRADGLDYEAARTTLLRTASGHRAIHSMSLRDTEGRVTLLTAMPKAPMNDTSESDYFKIHREAADTGTFIGKPIRSQVTGEWLIPVSRRLTDRDGRFAGVVVAAVRVNFFSDFFGTLQIGPQGLVALYRSDGTILVREPAADLIGNSAGAFRSAPIGTNVVRATMRTDGVERIMAFRWLPEQPLVVGVGVAVHDALAEWYRELRTYAAIWGLCAGLICLFAAILMRQARERERAELAAYESEHRFASLVANAPGVVFQRVRSRDGKYGFTFVSAKHAELVGYSGEDLVRNPTLASQIVHEDDRSSVLEALAESERAMSTMSLEFRVRRPDGELRWMHTVSTPRSVADGTLVWDGLMVDVTDRKQMEAALVRSEADASYARAVLMDAIESMNGGFVLYDAQDRLVLMNRAARDWDPDFAAAAVPGATHADLIRAAAKTGRIVGTGYSIEEIVRERIARHRRAFGQPIERQVGNRWYQITEYPTASGGVVVLRMDVTEIKRASLAAVDAQALAEEANRAKSDFLAMMSHELRTPLNAILGFSELLHTQASTLRPDKISEYSKDINTSGAHLLNLINDVLDLSKAEAGKMELQPEAIEVTDIIDRSLRMVRERAIQQDIRLHSELPPGLPRLWADERKLLQILLNLLSNAIKFTPSGGTITVRAEKARDMLAIRVVDTGIGIAPENMDTALSPFGQVHNLLTREHAGTGLGLPLVKRLVELHGGQFELQSKVEIGTTATLWFPLRSTAAAA